MPLGPMTKTVQNVLDRVKRQFGDESGAQVTDSDIISWINSGLQQINRDNRIIKGVATTPTVIGQTAYTFPGVNVLHIEKLVYNGRPINWRNFNEVSDWILEEDPNSTQTGEPILWYEWGNELNLYPKPDAVRNLSLYYVGYPAAVSASGDVLTIPDSYFDALLNYVLQQAYEQDDDWAASQLKGAQYKDAVSSLSGDGENYQRATYQTITIVDEDGWY